jgi:selenocysteine lyase/cysteine desulfurase
MAIDVSGDRVGAASSTERSVLAGQKTHFSLPVDSHYLNCAYMSPLSKRVQEAGVAGIRRSALPADIVADDFFSGCDSVRRLFAELVNAPDPGRIAIIPAASYGLSTAARNTPVAKGQSVVTVQHQFPSNVHVWRRLCASAGATLRAVGPPSEGSDRAQAWNEAILEAIDRDTAVVSLGYVHWTDGTRFDLPRIGERTREVGAAFIVDGTQSVGAMPFDVQRIQPDALVCAAYKWLTGPYSIGAAYFGSRYDDGVPLEETWLAKVESHDFAGLAAQSDRYRPGAARYDVGETANFVLVPMLIAALKQLLEWGVGNIEAYCQELTCGLFGNGRLRELGIDDALPETGHLFGLRLPPGADVARVHARLRERKVFVSVRGHLIRVSPHVYNDAADMEALLDALVDSER